MISLPTAVHKLLSPPDRQTVLKVSIAALVANALLVGVLAGSGVLKSTQTGDIQYTDSEIAPDGDITVPDDMDYRYAIERPTDADAFYNMVVRVWSGGPLYNTWQPDNVQEFHYLPVTYYFFAAISIFGYVIFKYLLFILSLLATIVGTYLLIEGEAPEAGFSPSRRTVGILSISSVAFAPMVANFKVGQVTPFAYAFIAVSWWAYRRKMYGYSGIILAFPTILKPYWAAPVALFSSTSRRKWNGFLGFGLAIGIANLLSVVGFGVDTTLEYYEIIAHTLLSETSTPSRLSEWSVEAINIFWFLDEFAVVGRILTAIPILWVLMRHMRSREQHDIALFSLSIIALFTVLQSTTLIDLGLLLAVFIVLGMHLYSRGDWPFATLVGAFLLAHAHTYVMEVLVGNGHQNLVDLIGNHPELKFLQPAVYAVLGVYFLALWVATSKEGVGR